MRQAQICDSKSFDFTQLELHPEPLAEGCRVAISPKSLNVWVLHGGEVGRADFPIRNLISAEFHVAPYSIEQHVGRI